MPARQKANGKDKNPQKEAYRLGAPRGDQKFEVANKIKAKRGGGEEWRQWSRPQLAQEQTEQSANDFYEKAFISGEEGKTSLNQMLRTLHSANSAMEDIRQPLENPYLEEDAKILKKEIAKYRAIAADRKARESEIEALKDRIHLHLRLLSGDKLKASTTKIPNNYEELMQAFLDVFPYHIGVVVPEFTDGRAVHPQSVKFEPGDVICFRELAPPTEDLLTHYLQTLPAGWVRQTYRPSLLALSTSLIAGGPNLKHELKHHHHHHHHSPGSPGHHHHHHNPGSPGHHHHHGHHGASGSHHF